jgi:hypothetical protein
VATFLNMVGPLAAPETLVICMQGVGGRGDWREGDRANDFACAGVEETQLPFSPNGSCCCSGSLNSFIGKITTDRNRKGSIRPGKK